MSFLTLTLEDDPVPHSIPPGRAMLKGIPGESSCTWTCERAAWLQWLESARLHRDFPLRDSDFTRVCSWLVGSLRLSERADGGVTIIFDVCESLTVAGTGSVSATGCLNFLSLFCRHCTQMHSK
uniref:Uncharacterized protein n=1 Tax=Noctiluca scintillans TaxID=2966 RepID=A0A7S1A1X9_NOCSC